VDFDSIPDLLVAPNLNGSINQGNAWLYQNTGASNNPVFASLDSNFFG
jgi:hypothetical protein